MTVTLTLDPIPIFQDSSVVSQETHDLEVRLDRGWKLIERRMSEGESVERLERHWLSLLDEYEKTFDDGNYR